MLYARLAVSLNLDKDKRSAAQDDDTALLTTGEMARCSNNTLRTVRFYEEEGILRPVRRTEGGHRLFDRSELDRLMLVTDLRLSGLSLDEIKHILDVKRGAQNGGEAARKATKVLMLKIEELRGKLEVLSRLRDDLAETSDIMTACVACEDDAFPHGCERCLVMASHASLPRSLRVLWSTKGAGGDASNVNGANGTDHAAKAAATQGANGAGSSTG